MTENTAYKNSHRRCSVSSLGVTISFGTKRDYDNCLHLDGEQCQLYDCKKCVDVAHHRLHECIFTDKTKFDWTDSNCALALCLKLKYFYGGLYEDTEMELNGKPITVKAKRHPVRKAMGKSPLDKYGALNHI